MGEFQDEQQQKTRKTMGSITTGADLQGEHLRRKTVGGTAVGGINIAAAQEFQYADDQI